MILSNYDKQQKRLADAPKPSYKPTNLTYPLLSLPPPPTPTPTSTSSIRSLLRPHTAAAAPTNVALLAHAANTPTAANTAFHAALPAGVCAALHALSARFPRGAKNGHSARTNAACSFSAGGSGRRTVRGSRRAATATACARVRGTTRMKAVGCAMVRRRTRKSRRSAGAAEGMSRMTWVAGVARTGGFAEVTGKR